MEPYEPTPFTVDVDGAYNVSVIEPIEFAPGTDDTILMVYETAFNPASGCTDLVGIGNEVPGTPLTVTLDDAASYVLVIGGFFGTQDDYTVRIQGPAASTVTVPMPQLTTTLTGVRDYRMLGLPTGGTYDDLLGDFWTQGFTGSDRPADGCSVYSYDETAGDFAGGYTCLADQGGAFARGRGAFVYVYADDDLDTPGVQGGFPKTLSVDDPAFTDSGAPFTYGSVLTYTNNPAVPSYQEGWNLLGNPLTAGMDWDETIRGGGLTPTVYVLDPNYFGGDYRTWTANIGGDLPGGVIPAFQGFFAKAVAAAPTLTAPVASVTAPGPGVYGKSGSEETPASLRFELALDGVPVSASFIAFTPEASLGEDLEDAYRLTPVAYPRAVLSTRTVGDAEALPLALNALPLVASGEIEIPLEVATEGHTATSLAMDLTWTGDLPEGWTATLVDRTLGTVTAVSEGGHYGFMLEMGSGDVRPSGLGLAMEGMIAPEASKSSSAASTGDRFALRLTPGSVTSTDDPETLTTAVSAARPNPATRSASVRVSVETPQRVRVSVLDMLGREVTVALDAEMSGAADIALDLSSLAPGRYAVQVAGQTFREVRPLTVVR